MRYTYTTTAVVWLLCALSAAAHPTTVASTADQITDSALKDIDAIPLPQATTIPAAVATTGRDGRADAELSGPPEPSKLSAVYWRRLIVFFAPGLLMAAAVGVAGGILGVLVLLRREALLALAMPQVVAAGAALGLRMQWATLPPALVAACAALLYLVLTRGRAPKAHGSDTIVPALYIAGLSVSFLVIAGSGVHVDELQKLFTGIDIAVTWPQVETTAPPLAAIALLCGALWRRWLLMAQAPAAAELAGLRLQRWDALFLALLMAVLLLGTNAQGIVMVLAMLFLPAAIVLPWARRIPVALISAAMTALLCLALAFVLSNVQDWPLSQSVGGVGFGLLLLSRSAAAIVGR